MLDTMSYLSLVTVGSAALLYIGYRPVDAWKLRKLPGPHRLPFLGNLVDIIKCGDMTQWLESMARKYGKVLKFWSGNTPYVLVSDPDLIRKLQLTSNTRPPLDFFTLLDGVNHEIAVNILLNLHGDSSKFKLMRRAFENALLPSAALTAHAEFIQLCVNRLVTALERFAATGEPVDVTKQMSNMTLDVIGYAAFGLDLGCLLGAIDENQKMSSTATANGNKSGAHTASQDGLLKHTDLSRDWLDLPVGDRNFGIGLAKTARATMNGFDLDLGTKWRILLYDVIRKLSAWFPDEAQMREFKARDGLRDGCFRLIDEWKRTRSTCNGTDTATAAPGGKQALSDRGFLSVLLTAQEKGDDVTDLDVITQTMVMVAAGYETTASTLSNILHLLSHNPDKQDKAVEELDKVLQGRAPTPGDLESLPYIKAVFDESLRLFPPGDATLRRLKADTEIRLEDGTVIPAGTYCWNSIYAIHRDPAVWPRPTEFIPERHIQPGNEELGPKNANGFMPFGGGTRMCPGYKLAQLEGRLALAALLHRYKFRPAAGCPETAYSSGLVYSPRWVWLTISNRK